MATYAKLLKNSNGDNILPYTRASIVYMDNDSTVESSITSMYNTITSGTVNKATTAGYATTAGSATTADNVNACTFAYAWYNEGPPACIWGTPTAASPTGRVWTPNAVVRAGCTLSGTTLII